MFLHSISGGAEPAPDGAPHPSRPVMVTATEPGRVDLLRVMNGLRQLAGSAEPARVFADLAAVCVPALCDEIEIGVEEAGGHRYRIRRPDTAGRPEDMPRQDGDPGMAIITGQSVNVRVTSLPGGGPEYTARVVCSWNLRYHPTNTDGALIGVVANYGVAVVHRERTTGETA